jgi:hypothetical protein
MPILLIQTAGQNQCISESSEIKQYKHKTGITIQYSSYGHFVKEKKMCVTLGKHKTNEKHIASFSVVI